MKKFVISALVTFLLCFPFSCSNEPDVNKNPGIKKEHIKKAQENANIKELTQERINEIRKDLKSNNTTIMAIAAYQAVNAKRRETDEIIKESLKTDNIELLKILLTVIRKANRYEFMPDIVQILKLDSIEIASLVIDALSDRNVFDNEQIVKEAIKQINNKKDKNYHLNLIRLLGVTGSKSAIKYLIEIIQNEDYQIQQNCIASLQHLTYKNYEKKEEWMKWWKLNKNKSRENMLEEVLVPYINKSKKTNEQVEQYKSEALDAKKKLLNLRVDMAKKANNTKELVAIMKNYMGDIYSEIRKYAAEKALTDLDKDVIQQLSEFVIERLNNNEEPDNVIDALLRILGNIDTPKSMVAMKSFIKYNNPSIRKTAISSIGNIALNANPETASAAISLLKMSLSDNNLEVVKGVVELLGKLKAKSAAQELISLLDKTLTIKEKQDITLQQTIIVALKEIGDPRGVPVIVKFLESENKTIRYFAVNALGVIGGENSVNDIIKMLKDESPDVRRVATSSLGEIGSFVAFQDLLAYYNAQTEQYAKDEALKALKKIGMKQMNMKNWENANAAFNTLFKLVANDKEIILSLITCKQNLKKYDEAISLVDSMLPKLTENDINLPAFKYEKITALISKEAIEEALSELKILNVDAFSEEWKIKFMELKKDIEGKKTPQPTPPPSPPPEKTAPKEEN